MRGETTDVLIACPSVSVLWCCGGKEEVFCSADVMSMVHGLAERSEDAECGK